MTLTVTNVSDNPEVPESVAFSYLPDQLIAGDKKIVSTTVLLAGGSPLVRGTVLGQMSSGAVGSAVAGGSNVGDGIISAISKGTNYQVGQYTIEFTGATAYNVVNPDGEVIGSATEAGAFTSPEINFTFTADTHAMAAGDSFTIAIAGGTGPYKESVVSAGDGSQTPSAILADNADPSSGDVRAGVYLAGEFNINALIYDTSWTRDTITAALRTYAIYVKGALSAADPS